MQALIFYICAVAVITGALGVVLAHNPVHSALFLLLTLVSVAILFLQQDAALVAIIQIVVYASAIVVLFVFVIALLGVDQHESESVDVDRRDVSMQRQPQARRFDEGIDGAVVAPIVVAADHGNGTRGRSEQVAHHRPGVGMAGMDDVALDDQSLRTPCHQVIERRVEVKAPQIPADGAYSVDRDSNGWALSWRTPGGGLQTSLVFDPAQGGAAR